MAIKRTRHAVYEANYHLVWTPKYRKWILRGDLREYVYQLFHRIAEQYDYEFEKLTIAEDHVHKTLLEIRKSSQLLIVLAFVASIAYHDFAVQSTDVLANIFRRY